MLICEYCGNTIEENDLETHEEDRGYCFGQHYYESVSNDCACGGTYVEAQKCSICEEWFNPDDLENGVCKKCLEENATFENALKIGEENEESISINGFIASVLGADKINKIVHSFIIEHKLDSDNEKAEKYCLEDKSFFAEWLEENND